jgi:hypothetical protein
MKTLYFTVSKATVVLLFVILFVQNGYSQEKQEKTVLSTIIKIGKTKIGKYNDNLPPIITVQNVDKIVTLTIKGKNIPANLFSGTADIYMIITKGKSSPEKIYSAPIQNNQISFTTRMLIEKVQQEKSFDLSKADELLIEIPKINNSTFDFPDKQRSVTIYLNLSDK